LTERKTVCVGWSGSASTIKNLKTIHGVLRDLSHREDVELRFIGGTDFGLPDVAHTASRWRAETEVEDIRRFDIGLVPLPVTEWNKRKFYVKLIQYMALGIPAVASPLGANPYVIEHGRTGFLAASAPDWEETVQSLIGDDELRARIGKAAAVEAHARYTLSANADQIVRAFRSARAMPGT
jgi:glycosyltransferase involved in cell wall biosynthesis